MAPSLEEPTTMSYPNPPPQTASNKDATMEANVPDHLENLGVRPKSRGHPSTSFQHIWYITGPAGCGKSTVAQYIASSLNLTFLEGDNFHPQENVDKMHAGHPLTDADRWDWLIALRVAAIQTLAGQKPKIPNPSAGSSPPASPSPQKASAAVTTPPQPQSNSETNPRKDSSQPNGVVLTCSALKVKYRDVLRVAGYMDEKIKVHFVYLHACEEMLVERVGKRKDHYMGADMVHSQFKSLEVPGKDEWDVIRVGVEKGKTEVEEEALRAVEDVVRGVVVDAE